jgi:hypothetical protein
VVFLVINFLGILKTVGRAKVLLLIRTCFQHPNHYLRGTKSATLPRYYVLNLSFNALDVLSLKGSLIRKQTECYDPARTLVPDVPAPVGRTTQIRLVMN